MLNQWFVQPQVSKKSLICFHDSDMLCFFLLKIKLFLGNINKEPVFKGIENQELASFSLKRKLIIINFL